MQNLTEKINILPSAPGVYFFRDSKNKILYIGKATNLRSRAQSYFRGDIASARSEWISLMVLQIVDIEFQETDSVLEALILESNLIKKYQPKYNTLEKDDKSFSYFVVTKEEFPRILIVRKTDLSKYVISSAVEKSNLKRGSDLSTSFYFAQDDTRKKIQNIKYDIQYTKVYGPYTSKYQMETALKIVRRIFPFHALKQKTEKGCLDFQLGLCPGPYADAISKVDYKKNIRSIEMILQGKKKGLVLKMEKEMQIAGKKEEFEKAAVLRNKIFALNHIRDVALINREFSEPIQDTRYKIQNTRIEAYDISNISGQHAVGSMVVFENGQPNKSQYRKFKIKTVEGSNDVAMMKEVLSRRFNNDWMMPDLILLDGGLGHLNMAEKLLHEELGLALDIASVAKGKERKNLDIRTAFIHNTKYLLQAYPRDKIHDTSDLVSQDDELKIDNILQDKLLVKSIMDEAHRFAIGYHRKLRSKNALQ